MMYLIQGGIWPCLEPILTILGSISWNKGLKYCNWWLTIMCISLYNDGGGKCLGATPKLGGKWSGSSLKEIRKRTWGVYHKQYGREKGLFAYSTLTWNIFTMKMERERIIWWIIWGCCSAVWEKSHYFWPNVKMNSGDESYW